MVVAESLSHISLPRGWPCAPTLLSKERPIFMKTLAALIIGFCALIWSASVAEAADAMRCGSRLISEGDPARRSSTNAASLPMWRPGRRSATTILTARLRPVTYREFERYGGAYRVKVSSEVEVWTYNYGPSRFIDYVRIENGKVRKIYSGGYGY